MFHPIFLGKYASIKKILHDIILPYSYWYKFFTILHAILNRFTHCSCSISMYMQSTLPSPPNYTNTTIISLEKNDGTRNPSPCPTPSPCIFLPSQQLPQLL